MGQTKTTQDIEAITAYAAFFTKLSQTSQRTRFVVDRFQPAGWRIYFS